MNKAFSSNVPVADMGSLASIISGLWCHHVFLYQMMGVIGLLGLAETFDSQVLLPVYIGDV